MANTDKSLEDSIVHGHLEVAMDKELAKLRAEKTRLETVIGYAYQVAGAHGCPDRILDVLADPLGATDAQVEAMLPYTVDDVVHANTDTDAVMRDAIAKGLLDPPKE